jgi:hypothetical protein
MKVQNKDVIATGLVAIAAAVYLMWIVGISPAVLDGVRPTGLVIVALGFVASAIAVVPNFDALLHGNRIYLVVTSLVGLLAVIAESSTGLAIVMGAMVVLWLVATVHHSLLDKDVAKDVVRDEVDVVRDEVAEPGRRAGVDGVGTRSHKRR